MLRSLWTLSNGPETQWKSESVTDGPTDGHTDQPINQLTGVGARDAYASEKCVLSASIISSKLTCIP